MTTKGVIYNESLGYGALVYYTSMVTPHESIQIFKYSYGNLVGSRLFSVGDICTYMPPNHLYLTENETRQVKEILTHASKMNDPSCVYTRITNITGKWVHLKYIKLPINEEFRILCSEFCWRNFDFVEQPPQLPNLT